MNEQELINYYNKFNEDKRLNTKHAQVEFLTAMKYIKDYLKKEQDHRHEMDKSILALEKSEQNIRENEVPFMRKFTFRGQIFLF